jgi:hypothetical protein
MQCSQEWPSTLKPGPKSSLISIILYSNIINFILSVFLLFLPSLPIYLHYHQLSSFFAHYTSLFLGANFQIKVPLYERVIMTFQKTRMWYVIVSWWTILNNTYQPNLYPLVKFLKMHIKYIQTACSQYTLTIRLKSYISLLPLPFLARRKWSIFRS